MFKGSSDSSFRERKEDKAMEEKLPRRL